MRKRIDVVIISINILLGLVHTACTPIFYKTFNIDALWFSGTGLLFVFLGLIHIIRVVSGTRISAVIAFLCSIVAVIFTVLIVVLISEPQAFIALVTNFLLLVFSGIALKRQ